MNKFKILFFTFVFLLISAKICVANQLHTEFYNLAQIANSTGYVLLGTALGVDLIKHKIKLKVNKIWVTEDKKAIGRETFPIKRDGRDIVEVKDVFYKIGEVYNIYINKGAEWTDPEKSPLEIRVWNFIDLSSVKKGEDVLIADQDLLKPDKKVYRKLDILFSKDNLEKYKTQAKKTQLIEDMKDYDLYELAYAVLQQRNQITTSAILEAKSTSCIHDVLNFHFVNLNSKQKKVFLKESLKFFEKKHDVQRIDDLLELATGFFDKKYENEIKKLISILNPNIEKEKELIESYYHILKMVGH